MSHVFAPSSEFELADLIAGAGPFCVTGRGTKTGFGRPVDDVAGLSLRNFAGVHSYEPEELVLEAGAATPLDDIQKLLSSRQQMLAFEPPDHSHFWGHENAGTIGGLLACGLAGPRRIKAGSARDHMLGLRGVTGRGEIFQAGARVVKNVTGYDVPKLMVGSFGTLAAFTSVILKVMPAPETENTIRVGDLDDETACRVMSAALQSQCEISAAAHLPGKGTFLRFEGIAESVASRCQKFLVGLVHETELLDDAASKRLWADIKNGRLLKHDKQQALWRLSVAPRDAWRCVAELKKKMDVEYMFDWGGGLVWLSVPADRAGEVRRHEFGGHATLYAAPSELRREIAVFHPQEKNLAQLTKRLKAAMDPEAKLNFGRMYVGV